jgi:hypothetical protein
MLGVIGPHVGEAGAAAAEWRLVAESRAELVVDCGPSSSSAMRRAAKLQRQRGRWRWPKKNREREKEKGGKEKKGVSFQTRIGSLVMHITDELMRTVPRPP